ncbi:hypothetical protein VTN77DRAFT_5373 [Rasamsonia byssochlamydoides]|uniref:uncharacterized protein n=1 Tax=Rasamsonia byssochlamydoides TaxID=89139 RepID=UPI00374427D0
MHTDTDTDAINLPPYLEEKTYARFDDMVRQGRIFYDQQTGPGELFVHEGFQFEFRIVPFLKGKPVLAADDPGRSKSPSPCPCPASSGPESRAEAGRKQSIKGPFISPNPDEVILDSVGPRHRLMLNKYCLYRPMLVLPTKEFALQSEDLDASDLSASWALLHAFPSFSSPLVIYNRGVNGGSSQGHKHLQLFPLPEEPFVQALLWPAKASSTETVATDIPHVPFRHFVLRIPVGATAETVIAMHDRLLQLTRQAHVEAGQSPDGDYNVALSREWIALIPRTTAGPVDGPFGTSTVGMLGLVAIRDEDDRKKWAELGYTEFLAQLGIPKK